MVWGSTAQSGRRARCRSQKSRQQDMANDRKGRYSLEKNLDACPARVETKPHSLVWHYRGAPPYYAEKYAVTIKRVFRPLLKQYGLELLQGNKVLEIKNPHVNKGAAAQRWLKRGYQFILALGDDMTDEELFAALPDLPRAGNAVYSIKIGRGRTAAKYRLPSSDETIKLLKSLAR